MEPSTKKSRIDVLDDSTNEGPLKHDDHSTTDILNDDCLLEVFQYLPISDRIRLERVNKRWREVSLASWRNFKKLNFTRDTWGYFDRMQVTTIILNKVLDRCSKYTTHLDMSNYHILVKEMSLEDIAIKCHNITSVILDSYKVTPQLLRILRKYPKIEDFSITEFSSLHNSEDIFERNFLRTCRNLKVLKIGNPCIYGSCLQALNNTMKILKLEYCDTLDFDYVKNVIPTLQQLRTLSLEGSLNFSSGHSCFRFLNLTNIKVLNLSNNSRYINDAFLIRIADSCRNLQSLNLSYNNEVTDEGLVAVTTSKLEHLRIDSLWHVTGTSLTELPALKSLSCHGCFNLKKNFVELMLKTSVRLHYLKVSNCPKVSREVLMEIAKHSVDSRQNDTILKIATSPDDVPTFRMQSAKLLVYD